MRVRYKVSIFLVCAASLLLTVVLMPRQSLEVIVYVLLALYTTWGIYHLLLLYHGLKRRFDPLDGVVRSMPTYPKISMIIPVRQEPILSRTIEACLLHTDYPMHRKEVVVVTEDEDMARIALYYQQRYPENVRILMRKNYYPTKPSALNDALVLCTGEIVGVVDAEDIVEVDLLRKVAYAITYHGYDTVQVMLRIGNVDDSWISRLFAMEYAGWFGIWLNARSRLRLYTPLGGTGNYIARAALREVGGWDATNLAEDAELAIRLMLAGKSICLIDARQWEEAPTAFRAWLKQRTRWYRGWLQSLWKYMPVMLRPSTARRIGVVNVIATIFMLIAPLVVMLNYIAYSLTMLWLLDSVLASGITRYLFPSIAVIPLIFNTIYYSVLAVGARKEGIRVRAVDMLYALVYMNVMMPLAALRAFYQSIFKDVFWEKTKHEGRGVRWVYEGGSPQPSATTHH
ncbi:MAG: glycosyltransferase [Candidatus Nitrosocaldus sp.]|nr:glycosyltransferase [Candidatus Nitrosocaldus sp.]MDW8000194.1 glycosyltransferase [Candidatus Nitrosocaldus sp.]